MEGWIKVHRKMLDNPIVFKDPDYLAVWMYLLLNATHKDYASIFMGKKYMLKPGQLITGKNKISCVAKVQESKVARILKFFKDDKQIELQPSNKNTLITIVNWDKYQDIDRQDDRQLIEDCQLTDTIQEQKNVKNERKEKIDYQQIADMYNNTCVSFPKLHKMSDSRKRAIKARLKVYSLSDLETAFQKAESSLFLKGNNDRSWSATFDWIMKDTNLAKILDGNYDSSNGRKETDNSHGTNMYDTDGEFERIKKIASEARGNNTERSDLPFK